MNQLKIHDQNIDLKGRRDFLKKILRMGVFGGLVTIGIALGRRRNNNGSANGGCPVNDFCKNCGIYENCTSNLKTNVTKF